MPKGPGKSQRDHRRGGKPVDKEFSTVTLDMRRVARVVAGGRRFSFRATVVIGDRKGRVGVGVAKGKDASASIEKATRVAKKGLIRVPIVNGTIPYEVYAKYKASTVLLRPARGGKGIVAGGPIRTVCEAAGIRDVTAKITSRTTNRLTNARAALAALSILERRYRIAGGRNR